MKKLLTLLALVATTLTAMAQTQTLNVTVGSVTYEFPAAR